MFCNYCGKPNPDDARFCSACGRAIRSGASPASTPVTATPAAAATTAAATPATRAAMPPIAARGLSLENRVLTGHRFPVYALAFSPDGRRLASGSLDRTARLWDLEQGREIGNFPATSVFTSVDFSSDGTTLALAASGTDSITSI